MCTTTMMINTLDNESWLVNSIPKIRAMTIWGRAMTVKAINYIFWLQIWRHLFLMKQWRSSRFFLSIILSSYYSTLFIYYKNLSRIRFSYVIIWRVKMLYKCYIQYNLRLNIWSKLSAFKDYLNYYYVYATFINRFLNY